MITLLPKKTLFPLIKLILKELIGSNSLGTVEVLGPFGNTDSDVRIAYLIGMHPLESKAHKALFDTVLSKNDSLNYCYYVYKINVSSLDDEERAA